MMYYLIFSIFQIQRKYVLSYPIDPLYFVGDETWGDFICRGGVTIKDNSECVDACKKLGLTSDATTDMKGNIHGRKIYPSRLTKFETAVL